MAELGWNFTAVGPGSARAAHSQCVPDRPACCARSTAAAPAAREGIKLPGPRSVFPEAQLQARRLHVEYAEDVTTQRRLPIIAF